MQYALVENGVVQRVGLPETGYLKDGSSVSGYNLLSEEVLKAEGWLPLEEGIIPEYNVDTQYVQHEGYNMEEDKVTYRYVICDIIASEPIPYVPTQEERIASLEDALNELILGGM